MSTSVELSPPGTATPPRPAPRSRSGVWALIARLHFYAGVFIAPFLVLAALTGFLYAFTPQLDGLVYAEQLRVEQATGTPRPLAEQITAATGAHPEGTVASVIPPADRESTTQVVLSVPALGDKQRTVYVDPYTAEVRGALTTSWGATPLTTWLGDLHKNLHLGEPGRIYSELAASWLWVIALGGLLMWLGRRRQYRGSAPARNAVVPDLSTRGVRRSRAWHGTVGVWIAVGLFVLSATGLTWSTYAGANFDVARAALRSEAPVLDTALPGATPSTEAGSHGDHGSAPGAGLPSSGVAIDAVLASARKAGLTGPVKVTVPADEASTWTVAQTDNQWPVRLDQVAVDPASGDVIARSRWADYPAVAKLSKLGIQAHMGRLFGLANQLLLAALALGLLSVIVWGYRMWWQRRPRGERRDGLVGKPPARGAWRQVPWPVLVIGVPVVVAVGWAMPLLGLSLAAFVLVDVAIGHLRRRAEATRS